VKRLLIGYLSLWALVVGIVEVNITDLIEDLKGES
jgi:hypothetical protein